MKRPLLSWIVPGAFALLLVVGCNQDAGGNAEAKSPKEQSKEAQPKLSKLVIEDTKEGTGPAIEKGDVAYLLYAGRLIDGTEFDSNLTARFPFSVTVGMGQVIKGWDEGLVGLKKGGKRTLRIPSDMAYGPQGREKIPPNSDLIFDVELVDLVKAGEEDIVDWETLTPGTGPACKAGDQITIDYVALSPLDSKFEEWTNQQFKLGTDGTIGLPGLDFGITGMKVGEKRRIRLPGKVAYGMGGRPDLNVPANMVVYFEVTLKGIG
jgi:FKBP-type peptidyl-prolyl cis-trans isomerase